jgi:pimeloyl-ACP methyl ester carboxylesterase
VPFIETHLSEPAALVGHSLVGMVGIIAAAQAPSLFKALVVGDSLLFWEGMAQNFPVDQKQVALARRRLNETVSIEEATHEMSHFFDLNDPWHRLFSQAFFQWDPAGQLGMSEALESKEKFTQGYDCEVLLPQITCPILLVQGDPDAPGPLSGLLTDQEIERAKALHPRVSAERIDGEWHALGMDNWDVIPFVRSITLFLETL